MVLLGAIIIEHGEGIFGIKFESRSRRIALPIPWRFPQTLERIKVKVAAAEISLVSSCRDSDVRRIDINDRGGERKCDQRKHGCCMQRRELHFVATSMGLRDECLE